MAVVCRAVALSGKTAEGIRLAQEALAYLPADSLATRARVLSALAAAHDLEGRIEEAAPLYRESISQAISVGDLRLAAHTLMIKGLVQLDYGQLHEAERTFQTIIDMPPKNKTGMDSLKNSNRVFFPAGQGYIGMGCIHWNGIIWI